MEATVKKIIFLFTIVLSSCATNQHWIYVNSGTIKTKYNETVSFKNAEVYRTWYHTEVSLFGGKYLILNKDIEKISLDTVYIKE